MPALKRHPLVRADLQHAFDWYEDALPGLGGEFRDAFRSAYRRLRRGLLLYAVRFSDIRRVHLERFPYGLFYTFHQPEIRILAVLHGSRETRRLLRERRRTFSAAAD